VQPVVDAIGEARPNVDVFAELEARLGLDRPAEPRDELEMMLEVINGLPEGVGDNVRAGAPAVPPFGTAPIQFVDVFPRTSDGKVHLFPEELDRQAPLGLYTYQPDPATATYPLALISPSNEKAISSSLYELVRQPAALTIHPSDAHEREIAEGDTVRVFNERGSVTCHAAVSPIVRPGTVALPKGLWGRHTLNGSTANALAPDTLSDIGAGACFNDARVQVEWVARAADNPAAAADSDEREAAERVH